jgi:predicted nuclease with TOPRIM domain
MFSWVRFAIIGVIVAALSAVAIKVTMYLSEKDQMVQERDKLIADLRAKAEGLQRDNDALRQSNASLAADRDNKRDELARAQVENSKLHAADAASNRRMNELQVRLNSRERLEQVERLRNSRRAELMLRVVNKSAKCELENFFQAGGVCKSGVWVKDGERLAPVASPPVAQTPAEAQPGEGSRAAR